MLTAYIHVAGCDHVADYLHVAGYLHAWDDRQGAGLGLENLLTGFDVAVWFSEMDVPLGMSLIRKIDTGLARSRAGIVIVTPALFQSLNSDGIAAQELPALLATDRVVPVVHTRRLTLSGGSACYSPHAPG